MTDKTPFIISNFFYFYSSSTFNAFPNEPVFSAHGIKKDEKNLVYAELMIKPSADGSAPATIIATTKPNKNTTEYAEIVYVTPDQKQAADKK